MDYEITITPIQHEKLITTANQFIQYGKLMLSSDNLLYLAIDDRFIKTLCPLINEEGVSEPDYFSIGVGAHISVIYPNEFKSPKYDLHQTYHFQIKDLYKAETKHAIYFVLTIHSQELIGIRHQNKLSEKLNLNGYIVDMHCTIGKINKV